MLIELGEFKKETRDFGGSVDDIGGVDPHQSV